MRLADSFFEGKSKILDLGGWFKPEPRATQVVDYLPWETRFARINLQRLPGEHFSKESWYQADFLDPNFRLPFEDKSFDLVLCGHTIEDLSSPENLLKEMGRVGVAGVIECPSRLTEQTLGMRDRMCTLPGHPHHHWIVESNDGELVLFSKPDSQLSSASRLVPLGVFEAIRRSQPDSDIVLHHWTECLSYRIATKNECADRARLFVEQHNITAGDRFVDRALRLARRTRAQLRGVTQEDFSWWGEIIEMSRPYSSIPLKS